MAQFLTIVTNTGTAKIASALASGVPINITRAAVGDGSNPPSPEQVSLQNELWRGEIETSNVDPANPQMVNVRFTLPPNVGGFTAREAGLFDEDGDLLAVCNMPDTQVERQSAGVVGRLTIVMRIVVTDTAALSFTVSQTGYISRDDVGQPNGIAPLDVTGKVPLAHLPPIDSGGVKSVNGLMPEEGGNVEVMAINVRQTNGQTIETVQASQDAAIASLQSGSVADQLRVAMLEGDFSSWAQRSGQSMTTVFNSDGSITQTARKAGVTVGILTTSFPADGSIIETLHIVALNKTITKTTSFPADGSISEVVT